MALKSIVSEPTDIRKNQPNIAFDKEDKVENVRMLKKLRSTAKGLVTRKRNETNDLLSCSTVPNIDELNKRAQDLETVMEKFRIARTNSTSTSVRVTTELHEKHAHAYQVIAVLAF